MVMDIFTYFTEGDTVIDNKSDLMGRSNNESERLYFCLKGRHAWAIYINNAKETIQTWDHLPAGNIPKENWIDCGKC